MAAGTERFERIAVEESYIIPEMVEVQARNMPVLTNGATPMHQHVFRSMLDLGEGRIKVMDEDGIAMQVCLLGSIAMQDIDPVQGNELCALANDRFAEASKKYPGRLAGLAGFAPLDPERAAREIERAVTKKGHKGAVINSHSRGEYLDDPKFSPIFEVLQALDAPLYIHPREPSPQMAKPFQVFGFNAGWSWAAETGTHVIRLIGNGVFDRFPKLKIVIGHMGEGIPFHLDRIDSRYFWEHEIAGIAPRLKRKPSDYVHDNVFVTTSGANFVPPLLMTIQMMGIDNVLFAGDWPFEKVRESVDTVDAAPISASDKRKLYSENAKRVFKL